MCPTCGDSGRFVTYKWVDGKRYAQYTCGQGHNWLEEA